MVSASPGPPGCMAVWWWEGALAAGAKHGQNHTPNWKYKRRSASREGTSCQCPKADVCKAVFAFALAVDRIKFLMVKDGECPPLFTSH